MLADCASSHGHSKGVTSWRSAFVSWSGLEPSGTRGRRAGCLPPVEQRRRRQWRRRAITREPARFAVARPLRGQMSARDRGVCWTGPPARFSRANETSELNRRQSPSAHRRAARPAGGAQLLDETSRWRGRGQRAACEKSTAQSSGAAFDALGARPPSSSSVPKCRARNQRQVLRSFSPAADRPMPARVGSRVRVARGEQRLEIGATADRRRR